MKFRPAVRDGRWGCISDNSSPPIHWGAARSQIFPVSLSGQTPPCGCILKSSGMEVCCLRSLLILVSAHWLINRGSFNCTLTLTKWTDIIYQLGVQWGDVGRKCLLTELFFISSLAQSALHCTPLKGLKQFSSCSDDGVFFLLLLHFFFSLIKSVPSVQSTAVYQV